VKEFLPYSTDLISRMPDQSKVQAFFEMKKVFTESWVPMEVLRGTYQYLVNSGQVEQIESLVPSEKKRLWGIIKSWVNGSEEYRVTCVKVLHLIEILQDKKIEI
jgi:hypothetical protein